MLELAVFDMAGTTVDDHGLVYVALQQAVEETGVTVAADDLQRWMGTDKVTAIDALIRLGGVEPAEGLAERQFERFKVILAELYERQPPQPIGGAVETLRELRSRGVKVVLTTGFDAAVATPLLRSLGWAVAGTPDAAAAAVVVDAVVTTDDVPAGRPHPYLIFRAMERTGVADVRAVLSAGDTAVDVRAAHNSGALAIGVLSGGAPREILEREPYDYLLDSVADVVDLPELSPTPEAQAPTRSAAPTTSPRSAGVFDPQTIPDNDYLLLTPGPLSTTKTVRAALLKDWCTWDEDYKALTRDVRNGLVALTGSDDYTAVLMQGSGTFAVESLLGSVLGPDDKVLILANGAYGRRMTTIADMLRLPHTTIDFPDTAVVDVDRVGAALDADPAITHVAMVHCETTTGLLNPLAEVCRIAQAHGKRLLIDAMSSFGGVEIDAAGWGIDFLVSSSNKCIQGVPGFGFVLARQSEMERCRGFARSHALDLYDQWETMERGRGKWRFTSPTHVVHAFAQALAELRDEGGVRSRSARYTANQATLVEGMAANDIRTVIAPEHQSPIITAFHYPVGEFDFATFYRDLKDSGFVIYPGKLTELDTFRVGTIGDVHPGDMRRLTDAVARHRTW
ncbi:2-aminoethylphosphonate--pyruvate transaminase [Raineyella sp. W15-4]|uniref:2-aminoethylphosphonate--pyruvate transaminase n=1 Tax=Raineyella sp. W15-4 TaxID=3081651 RepID=UPI002953DB5F|nr:2-aminoethylphosphonate--pyruvate transaminase [Raineyella sp. W15-4]WOQ16519.1 2-aminoethylphosphonate--pyruvate transaminase [Raineyella sp. W15-4]